MWVRIDGKPPLGFRHCRDWKLWVVFLSYSSRLNARNILSFRGVVPHPRGLAQSSVVLLRSKNREATSVTMWNVPLSVDVLNSLSESQAGIFIQLQLNLFGSSVAKGLKLWWSFNYCSKLMFSCSLLKTYLEKCLQQSNLLFTQSLGPPRPTGVILQLCLAPFQCVNACKIRETNMPQMQDLVLFSRILHVLVG